MDHDGPTSADRPDGRPRGGRVAGPGRAGDAWAQADRGRPRRGQRGDLGRRPRSGGDQPRPARERRRLCRRGGRRRLPGSRRRRAVRRRPGGVPGRPARRRRRVGRGTAGPRLAGDGAARRRAHRPGDGAGRGGRRRSDRRGRARPRAVRTRWVPDQQPVAVGDLDAAAARVRRDDRRCASPVDDAEGRRPRPGAGDRPAPLTSGRLRTRRRPRGVARRSPPRPASGRPAWPGPRTRDGPRSWGR